MATHTFDEEDVQEMQQVAVEGQNLIKASLFNLIVVADSLQRGLHCQELVNLVTEKFPCRVIFIQSDISNQPDLFQIRHKLQAIGTGQTRVCFDQYTIESSVSQLQKVPYLVMPNIMPDLPVYILLGHDPTQDHTILPHLQKYANRVIFDCESIDNLQRFSERIQAMNHETCADLIDVNWGRTKAWREVMARVFNDQEKLEALNHSKQIQITFSGSGLQPHAKHEIQSIYIQAWLAGQFGWNLIGVEKIDGAQRINYRSTNSQISVTLIPRNADILEPGAIFSCEVLTHNDSHFLISHEGDKNQVVVHASNLERCEMPYSIFLGNYQRGTALVNEIFYQPASEHYHNMLQVLANPAWGQAL